MTVLTETRKADYVGDGSTTVFPYNFLVFKPSELVVSLDQVDQTSGYTVSGINNPQGGNVTFDTAPALDVAIRIERTLPITQLVDYQAYDAFPAQSHEEALDRIVMILQQFVDSNEGLVQSDIADLFMPPYKAGEYIRWSTSTQTLENGVPVAQTVNQATDGEAVDGGNQTFYVFNPEQLMLAVQAHLHSVSTNPPIEVVASLPGTPTPNTIYYTTT